MRRLRNCTLVRGDCPVKSRGTLVVPGRGMWRRVVWLWVVCSVLLGCGTEATEPPARQLRAKLSGDSELVAMFELAEERTGTPAEVLATVAWVQTALTMRRAKAEVQGAHDHVPREHGLMAIGTGGLTTLERAAARSGYSESEIASEPLANIVAAASLLAVHDELRESLVAYGGDALANAVLRLLRDGWRGSDEHGQSVVVEGHGVEQGLGVLQLGLGYPGAIWNPAHSGNYTNASRGAGQINYVVIHTVQGSYAGCISWFKNPAANVSAHYVVRSSDGEVTQMVDDADIAHHDGCFNSESIGIEHEGYVEDPGKWYTPAMYKASAKLTAWLCDKYGIPKDRQHIMGHGETPDCSTHTDPGSGWDWDHYMHLVETGGVCQPQCAWDGNLINQDCSVTKCTAVGATCVSDGGLRCASVFCVEGGKTPAKDVCLPDGQLASCNPKGELKNLTKCDAGETCVTAGDETRCGLECVKQPVAGAESEPFQDMPASMFGHDEAIELRDAGIASGCSNDPPLFCAKCEMTRQAFVTWLVRAAKLSLIDPATPSFTDVPKTHTFYKEIETAAKHGIVSGYADGSFKPMRPMTRASAAALIARTRGWTAPTPLPESYTDVPPDHPFHDAIESLRAHCVTSGCNADGSAYCPNKLLTRASAAVLMARAFELASENACGPMTEPGPGAGGSAGAAGSGNGGWGGDGTASGGTSNANAPRTSGDDGGCSASGRAPQKESSWLWLALLVLALGRRGCPSHESLRN